MSTFRGLALALFACTWLVATACVTETREASAEICTPSQLVRCNDCSKPPGDSRVYRGWIQCAADGTSFVGTCTSCAPDGVGNDAGPNAHDSGNRPGSERDGAAPEKDARGSTEDDASGDAAPDDADDTSDTGLEGGDDDSSTSVPPDACAGLPDGAYCGGDMMDGDPSTLYTCTGGMTTSEEYCSSGCDAVAGGTDFCN